MNNIGNMNRAVKLAKKMESGFHMFNCQTGEIVEGISARRHFYGITKNHYPVFAGTEYKGVMWNGEFLTPENFYPK